MTTTKQKYNRWKFRKEAFKKLKEMGRYEIYIDHKVLSLDNNNIKEIPSWIRELKELELLHLENNNIEEIPEWIGGLKELKRLLLPDNNIQEISTETLKECNSLERLWLIGNPIPKKEIKRAKKELNINIVVK